MPAELQPELLDDFYAESDEHLQKIREGLILLEQSVDKALPDLAVVEDLLRSFHSLKGIAGIVGLRPAEEVAHASEDFLRELSRAQMSLSAGGLATLMTSVHNLDQIIVAFRGGNPLPAADLQVGSFERTRGESNSPRSQPPNAAVEDRTSSAEASQIEEAKAQGLVLWRCTFVPRRGLDERGINVTSIRTRLTAAGVILSTKPRVRSQGDVAFEFIVGVRETPRDIADWEADGVTVELLEQNAGPASPSSGSRLGGHTPFIAPSHIVRVDLKRLDDLMRITGELFIHRLRLEDQLSHGARGGGSLDPRALGETSLALSRSLRELRESIMGVRLVPVAEIFARMPFVVRDLAQGTDKQVRLSLEGQQTQLDKYLVERLKDPLLHLVRNAFSHGAETPGERIAAGKPAEAAILLRAFAQGDSVFMQIRDDGRGVDAKAVARRAAGQGIAVPEVMDSSALLTVLCTPGFSTRDGADRAAGRGIGMSVVCETVRELGGSISLETEMGRGTQFTLRLPLTLAITEAFIVSSDIHTYAVPQSFVSEVLQVDAGQVRTVARVEVIPYRSGVLPITRLSAMFRLPRSEGPRLSVLVLSSERGRSGLVVDRIHGQREIVVRPLRDPLLQVPAITGATELGDGRPVLILDGAVLTSGPVRPRQDGEMAPESSLLPA